MTPVYQGPELTEVDGKRFHNWCFRCQSCNSKLSACTGNYRMENGKSFCHICFDKLCNPQKVNYPLRNPEANKLTQRKQSLAWEAAPSPSLISGWLDKPKDQDNKFTARRVSESALPAAAAADTEEYGFDTVDNNAASPFVNAGSEDGVEIWRMEDGMAVQKFNIPSRDKPVDNVGVHAHNGILFQGDVYILLNTLTKPSGKRFAEIFVWIGKDASYDDEAMALDMMPAFKNEIESTFENKISHRRIKHQAEGPFFRKFQDAYGRISPMNFKLQYRPGGYAMKGSDNLEAMQAAAAAFEPRLIRVHIGTNQTVDVEEVPCNEFSMSSDSVFLLETYGKIYQYNGIKCKPVERFEGRSKFQAMAKELEESIESTRPRTIDYQMVMQTRSGHSAEEQLFFEEMAGDAEPWTPMSGRQEEVAYQEAHVANRRESRYDGTKWQVRDSTVYNHSTSFFGGLSAAGPGRNKGRSG